MSLWCEFNVDEELRKTFPQVFELISLLLTTKNHLNPSIEIPFIEGKIPHHVFLYGFALHQKVPLKMRKKILKNIHLKEVHKIPRKK